VPRRTGKVKGRTRSRAGPSAI